MAERQYGTALSQIRADHVGRYEWACDRIFGTVLDASCGCGYGSAILSDVARRVVGVDRDAEAIRYARLNWRRDNVEYRQADVFDAPEGPFDAVCSFETVEHVEDDVGLLRSFSTVSRRLLISVPNEDVIPFSPARFPFHVRHYTPLQFISTLNSAGWHALQVWTQADAFTRAPTVGVDGRTLVAVCEAR